MHYSGYQVAYFLVGKLSIYGVATS